jgi:hypothetical protein
MCGMWHVECEALPRDTLLLVGEASWLPSPTCPLYLLDHCYCIHLREKEHVCVREHLRVCMHVCQN